MIQAQRCEVWTSWDELPLSANAATQLRADDVLVGEMGGLIQRLFIKVRSPAKVNATKACLHPVHEPSNAAF